MMSPLKSPVRTLREKESIRHLGRCNIEQGASSHLPTLPSLGAMLSATSKMNLYDSRSSKLAAAGCILLVCILAASWIWRTRQELHRLQGPNLVYWAWERPEDLRLLDPQKEAVTFLASSVELLPDRANLFPHMQPLLLSPGTHLVAMVRIYSHPASPAALNSVQFEAVVNAAVSATGEPNVAALQIDSRYISIFGCAAADGQQDLWQTECLHGTVFSLHELPVRKQPLQPVIENNGSEVHTQFLHHRAH
jgi:hypothetical protein